MNREVAKIFSRLIFSDRTVKIKILGDSICHGKGGTGFEKNGDIIIDDIRRNPNGYCWANLFKEHVENNFNCKVVNNGVCGVTIDFLFDNYDKLVDEDDDIVICAYGNNDRGKCFDKEPLHTREEYMKIFYDKIITLHDRLKSAGKQVIFIANIPALDERKAVDEGYHFQFNMRDVSDIYLKASIERGIPLINLYTSVINYCESHNVELSELLADNVHPNDKGYLVMFNLLMDEFGIARNF